LRAFSGADVWAVLDSHGINEFRHPGSDILMRQKRESNPLTIPFPDAKELYSGTE